MIIEYDTTERFSDAKRIQGPMALDATDDTSKVRVRGIAPGRTMFYRGAARRPPRRELRLVGRHGRPGRHQSRDRRHDDPRIDAQALAGIGRSVSTTTRAIPRRTSRCWRPMPSAPFANICRSMAGSTSRCSCRGALPSGRGLTCSASTCAATAAPTATTGNPPRRRRHHPGRDQPVAGQDPARFDRFQSGIPGGDAAKARCHGTFRPPAPAINGRKRGENGTKTVSSTTVAERRQDRLRPSKIDEGLVGHG